ncbi:MAG: hypothetical protein ABIN80_28960 [Dyadobacter sp.]|uniref:hypothetical protein n=1 Tax=Dyadobacter sp. TaxID=1914288 RepID=UPI003267DB1B
MKKRILITLNRITTFALGYGFNSLISHSSAEQPLKKATGIGGIFFQMQGSQKSPRME